MTASQRSEGGQGWPDVARLFRLGLAAGGLGSLAVAARWADVASWTGLGQLGLVVAGVALVVWSLLADDRRGHWTEGLSRKVRSAVRASDTSGANDPELYWFVPFAVLLALIAIALAVVAGVALADLTLAEVWPWLVLGLAVLALLLALMAISYAPPGPNWVQRLANIEGWELLILVGLIVLLVGTYQMFGFPDGSTPSLWWSALVIAGLFMVLMGIRRSWRPKRRAHPRAAWAATAAREARRAATEAEQAKAKVIEERGQHDPLSSEAERAARCAADRAERAEELAKQAAESQGDLREQVDRARRRANEAIGLADQVEASARAVVDEAPDRPDPPDPDPSGEEST